MMEFSVEKISCGYRKTAVIHDISFRIGSGELLCVIGANGSGKSTLIKALIRHLPLMGGRMHFNGNDAVSMSEKHYAGVVSYVPQLYSVAFAYTVADTVMMGMARHMRAPTHKHRSEVTALLDKLGIAHLARKPMTELSGGERRLALIARAIYQNAQIVVLDEPAADLDYYNQQLVMRAVRQLKTQGYGIILTEHSLQYASALADQVLLLKQGRPVTCSHPQEALSKRNLQAAFGVDMEIHSVRDASGRAHSVFLPSIAGEAQP